MKHFIIYALPRSRAFWLSRFLSYGPVKCGHDELRHVRGLDDIKSLLEMPFYGSAETAAAPWWRLLHTMQPDLRPVVIRRPVRDVVASLVATGLPFDRPKLANSIRRLDAKLDQIKARVDGALEVGFADLEREDVCARIFEHCTGMAHDPRWFEIMAPLKLTVDLEANIRYTLAHREQLERVGRLAKQRILLKMTHRPVSSDAITFQQESFADFLRDGQTLFAEHLIEVGEHPSAWTKKNLPLMHNLEKVGALYVTTARSNGRMLGYLMSVVAPALDSRTGIDGVQTLFYASPDAPGVGLKLQRASIEFLRTKGATQVAFRAGVRGSAGRASALFRRLGAADAGRMFVLDLEEGE